MHRDLRPDRPPVRNLPLWVRRLAAFSYHAVLAVMVVKLLSEIETTWGAEVVGLL